MKHSLRFFPVLAAAIALMTASSPLAFADPDSCDSPEMMSEAIPHTRFLGPIDWKVGDRLSYQITFGFLGKIGTIEKEITKEEGAGVWLRQVTLLTDKSDIQEMLVERSSGKVIKYIKNGQEAVYTEEVLLDPAQTHESVTVPAGTFEAVHLTGKTQNGGKIDLWSNPEKTAIDGMIKSTVDGTTNVELMTFHRAP